MTADEARAYEVTFRRSRKSALDGRPEFAKVRHSFAVHFIDGHADTAAAFTEHVGRPLASQRQAWTWDKHLG